MNMAVNQVATETVTDAHDQTRDCALPGKAATLLLSTDGLIVGRAYS